MNNTIRILIAISLSLSFFITSEAQKTLTLKEAVELAKNQSIAAKRAETTRENRYWQYRRYQANYNPQLQLSGTIPTYTRAVRRIEQPDGTFRFIDLNRNTAELELSLSQSIAATGGRLFVSSSMQRADDFIGSEFNYGGDPVSVGFAQPLFNFNALKWDKKIEPLRYEESKREYVEEFERISSITSSRFFDLLTAQIQNQIATLNVQSNDTIYKIAQGRYQLGKIPENDLLQLELNLMNARQQVAQAELDFETAQLRLKSYLGIANTEEIELIVPSYIPTFPVDADLAIEMANQNRSDAIAFQRRRTEADASVAQAVGNTGLNADLFGSFGLSNNGATVPEIYQEPDVQVVANIGFQIPIIDWGRQKSVRKTQEAFQQLTYFTVQQDEIQFEQEVYTQVRTFMMLRNQVEIASKADEISQKRYEIAKNRYLIGKISITDLSLALTEKDQAKSDYLSSLGNFWQAYYNLRSLTLYDFEVQQVLYNPNLEYTEY